MAELRARPGPERPGWEYRLHHSQEAEVWQAPDRQPVATTQRGGVPRQDVYPPAVSNELRSRGPDSVGTSSKSPQIHWVPHGFSSASSNAAAVPWLSRFMCLPCDQSPNHYFLHEPSPDGLNQSYDGHPSHTPTSEQRLNAIPWHHPATSFELHRQQEERLSGIPASEEVAEPLLQEDPSTCASVPYTTEKLRSAIHGRRSPVLEVSDEHFKQRVAGSRDTRCSSSRVSTRSSQPRTSPEQAPGDFFLWAAPYVGPSRAPPITFCRFYNNHTPVAFPHPPLQGASTKRGELRLWESEAERTISQNSSQRKVNRALWLSPHLSDRSFPVALKFVQDANARDGRSVKREIECHLFLHQRLDRIKKDYGYQTPEDAWPSAELFAYHLDKINPGKCVLVTRMLSGPDFFDVIRAEHDGTRRTWDALYCFQKLQWSYLALKRISQFGKLGIRHNDIKPDNIVLDRYEVEDDDQEMLDVKIIDLGTASMANAKDFTGGTTWYESPEQKMLEYYTKKRKDPVSARAVNIGLASDAWGTGLSLSEVLMGCRVVDVLKQPKGPGPLEYQGSEKGWTLEPQLWIQRARQALRLHAKEQKLPLCKEAACFLFDSLVVPCPEKRATIDEVIPHLLNFMYQAHRELKPSTNGPSV